MNAAEFQTTVHDGVITLPGDQHGWNGKKIRVILLDEGNLEATALSAGELTSDNDFFGCSGIWKNRNITQESIREKAWRDRN